jgi:ketosteroid isomerase-like protein
MKTLTAKPEEIVGGAPSPELFVREPDGRRGPSGGNKRRSLLMRKRIAMLAMLSAAGSVMKAEVPPEERGSREIVLRVYQEFNQAAAQSTELSRAEHATRVVERHFAPGFVGHGGPDNLDYDLDDFKTIIRELYGRPAPDRNSLEDVISEGDKTLVRVRIHEGDGDEVNYMAFYRVKGGQIVERWTYGDRNHR